MPVHTRWRPALKWVLASFLAAFGWQAAAAAESNASARPVWVERYLADPPEAWEGWRNALRPKGEPAPPLALVAGGRTGYAIVVPEKPTLLETRAADELQLWLGEITGAEFPIVADTTPARAKELSVGRTRRAAGLGEAARKRAGLESLDRLPREGYTIAVEGERVYLLGGTQSGPLNAVLALLEEDLGVRWYGAAIRGGSWDELSKALNARRWVYGDVRAPRQPDLRAAIVPRTVTPAVPIRHLSWQQSYNPWALRNRVNGGYVHQYGQHGYADGGVSVHTFHRLVPPKEHFEKNPGLYSLIGGKRRWEQAQLCLSYPETAAVAAKTAAGILRRIPASQRHTRHLLDVSAEDWTGDCECEGCRGVEKQTGSYSGLQLTFVNRVAERLAAEFPWVTVTTLAYRQSKTPPRTDLRAHPNVAVRFCTDFGASFDWPYHSFLDGEPADVVQQRGWFTRWQQLSPRMHLWIYPHQYRNALAPMPSIRAVADNLRFFSERGAESLYVQQSVGADLGREAMRYWVFAKLMWDPSRDVDDLIRDFIWGYYGGAAPAVFAFHRLLWDHHARYTDFSRKRSWIYPIHEEAMYQHGFVEQSRAILAPAAEKAESDEVRRRVELLLAGVVYVESVRLYMQMRDSQAPPDTPRYAAVRDELAGLCDRLAIRHVGFFDGARTVAGAAEWVKEMGAVRERRLDPNVLPPEAWGAWTFRWDPEEKGIAEEWFGAGAAAGEGWTPVKVPAFLADTPAGNATGYGWYRTTFTLPAAQAGKPLELHFGGVDEQAWVYVNGKPAGEHTLKSEFMVGQEISVADLWNRPFALTVAPELLKAGENVLVVRIHNSAFNAGIHQPVRAYLRTSANAASDGSLLDEGFDGVAVGGIPAGWERYVQPDDRGGFHGIAAVSGYFIDNRSLHLQDRRSHVAVWTVSDEVLPAGKQWAVQLDFRLTGGRSYKASDKGALFGLKQGDRRSGKFLPLVHLDNDETPGKPVTLLGLGHVLDADLAPNQWHRLVVHRDGTTWRFYLNDELKQTVTDVDTDCRGLAFGSFLDWQHVAQDVHYDNLRVGRFQRR